MKKFFNDLKIEISLLFQYLKSPKEEFNEKLNFGDKQRIFSILMISELLFTVLVVIPIFYIVDFFFPLKDSDFLSGFHVYMLLVYGVLIAPLMEEILFRLPLKWKNNYLFRGLNYFSKGDSVKSFWFKNYRFFFYTFAIVFGLIHLFNYENRFTFTFLLLSPFIILSQLVCGFVFGYVRNRLGFLWSVAYHGLFNFILLIVPYLVSNEEQIVKIESEKIQIEAQSLMIRDSNESFISINERNDTIFELNAQNEQFSSLMKTVYDKDYYSRKIRFINMKMESKKGIHKKELLWILKGKIKIDSIRK